MEYDVIDINQWLSLPAPTPPKPKDKYEDILNTVESGSIVKLAISDPKEIKGTRISLGRKARARGFALEYRNDDKYLYVRKSDRVIPPEQREATESKEFKKVQESPKDIPTRS